MSLKDVWVDKIDGVDIASANDINQVAQAVIELEEKGVGSIIQETDPTVPNWAKQPSKPTYTAEEVGAQPAGNYALKNEIPNKLSQLSQDAQHRLVSDVEKNNWNNKSEFSGDYNDLTNKPTIPIIPVHSVNGKTGNVNLSSQDVGALSKDTFIPQKTSDLNNDTGFITVAVASLVNYYLKSETYSKNEVYSNTEVDELIEKIDKRLNAFFDTNDTTLDQLSEIVAYIKKNEDLIDEITTSKINVSDIIDNLTTSISNKPLSATQGVVLKGFVDKLTEQKLDVSALNASIDQALLQAKESGEFDGADGYTPQRGIDYWTEEDKEEINADNITFISTELAKRGQLKPEFANSIEECTDTTKLYVLPDGYIYAYMKLSGFSKTNIMPIGSAQTKNGLVTTLDGNGGYILNGTATSTAVHKIYESTSALPNGFTAGNRYKLVKTSGHIGTFAIMIHNGTEFIALCQYSDWDVATSFEFEIPENAIGLQIKYYPATNYAYSNESLKFECYEAFEGYAFSNTGHAFVPTDYEDRIIDLENAVEILEEEVEKISSGVDIDGELPKPMLTIIDDDGYKKFANLLLPIIENKNVPISSAVPSAYANGEVADHVNVVMGWAEIEECSLAGAEILSHTYCHLTQAKAETMTKEEIQRDYQRAQYTMRNHGYKADGLVFAGGSVDMEKCQNACKNVYKYGFKASGDKINKKGSINPYRIDRYKIEQNGLLNEVNLKALIDALVTDGTGWMVWMIHTSDGGFQQTQADIISAVIDYAISRGVEIVTTECGARHYL